MENEIQVILVDRNDHPIGVMEKMEAHEKALLHRAFSIFIFNSKGEMLIHQRASSKYHSPGLWTNACCSHPMPGETTEDAAHRRLMEEMGMTTQVEKAFSFIYKAELDQGLTEHELDHVFIAHSDEVPQINLDEVKSWKYINIDDLQKDVLANSEHYTVWFKIALERVIENKHLIDWDTTPLQKAV